MPPDRRGLLIRTAGEADLDALADLRRRWASPDASDPAFIRRLAGWLAAESGRRTIWLALAADVPVGMISLFEYRRMPRPRRLDARWGYVGNLFVREEHRRRGIGSALLGTASAAADSRGYDRLVVSPSEEALELFRRAGFRDPGPRSGADPLLVRPGSGHGHR